MPQSRHDWGMIELGTLLIWKVSVPVLPVSNFGVFAVVPEHECRVDRATQLGKYTSIIFFTLQPKLPAADGRQDDHVLGQTMKPLSSPRPSTSTF